MGHVAKAVLCSEEVLIRKCVVMALDMSTIYLYYMGAVDRESLGLLRRTLGTHPEVIAAHSVDVGENGTCPCTSQSTRP